MIATIVGELQPDEDFEIDLNQEVNVGLEENDLDEEGLEQEHDPQVRRTSSGRTLKFQNYFFFGSLALRRFLPPPPPPGWNIRAVTRSRQVLQANHLIIAPQLRRREVTTLKSTFLPLI